MGKGKNTKGASVASGLSSQESMDKGYTPRDSGQGQRPKPAKTESADRGCKIK
jgi:hypothetical protein